MLFRTATVCNWLMLGFWIYAEYRYFNSPPTWSERKDITPVELLIPLLPFASWLLTRYFMGRRWLAWASLSLNSILMIVGLLVIVSGLVFVARDDAVAAAIELSILALVFFLVPAALNIVTLWKVQLRRVPAEVDPV
jgi:hypothetical protein